MNIRGLGLAALAAALLTTACGGSGTKSVDAQSLDLAPLGVSAPAERTMRDLYTAAVNSGKTKIVIYGPNQAVYQPVVNKAFEKRFPGLSVSGQPYTGAELESRLATEFSSGKHVADLIESTTYIYLDKDYYQPYVPTTAAALGHRFRGPKDMLWGASGTLFGFMYNTDKIKAADAPKSWAELADPRWSGQIVSGDPSQPSAASDMLIKLQSAGVVDDAWLHKLAANKLTVKRELELADQAVAQGEFGIVLTTIYNYYANDKKKGAPLAFVHPADGVMIEPNFFGLVKGAANTDAAKLFQEWLFSKEGQQRFVDLGTYPLMPGAPTGPDLPPVDRLKVLDVPDPAAMNKLWGPGTTKLKSILGGGSAN
ncbi:ABC transporter substrate-binding protein [Pseudonocardia acaciae]|uniref:ABC transporter substrate-binding protein n=1 Tax=Pseudonocardia acaciae TaxID=551276 RepID=UPI00048EBBF6|nr:extracellular solute-binding protein [Pseudonocardia acaciae]